MAALVQEEVQQQHSSTGSPYAATLASIQAAAKRIAPFIHTPTPVLTCSQLDKKAGASLFFKCEAFQRSGSFKIRGACNAVMSLTDEVAAKGICTHSSGNHGAAIALASQLRSVPAHVIVPSTTPQCKVDAIQALGGTVIKCEPTMEGREQACAKLQAEIGATFIPPYNHPDVISGQGTIAIELLQQVADLDAIVVPVSGGGMISGIAVAAKALSHGRIKVVAAEPCGQQGDAADVAASLAQGRLVTLPKPITIADGLQGRLGDLTWPIVRDHVDAAVSVTEAEIVAAMKLVYEGMKVVVEPSGAVGLAAVLSPTWKQEAGLQGAKRIAVILCGGNVDLEAQGLWASWPV